MKRLIVVSLVALAIGVAWAPVARAASAPPVSVEQYVNSVCTSMTTFQTTSADVSQDFQDNTATLTKVPAVKKQFVAFFDSLHDAVMRLQADLAAAGTPELAHGDKIAKQLRSGIAAIESGVAEARDDAASLKTTNPNQFAKRVTALGEKLSKAMARSSDGFDDLPKKYDTSSLKAAQIADADCAALNG